MPRFTSSWRIDHAASREKQKGRLAIHEELLELRVDAGGNGRYLEHVGANSVNRARKISLLY
jgi:hypothetical protein